MQGLLKSRKLIAVLIFGAFMIESLFILTFVLIHMNIIHYHIYTALC